MKTKKKPEKKKQAARLISECRCEKPRKLRASRSMFEAGPIACGVCMSLFEIQE